MRSLHILSLLPCLLLVASAPVGAQTPTPPGYTSGEWEKLKNFQLKQAEDATKISRDSPVTPKDPTASEGLCNQPKFNGRSEITHIFTPRSRKPQSVIIGSGSTADDMFDMTNDSCIPKSYDLYVRNETPVNIRIWQDPNAKCTAVESYADNPIKDYGSVFTGVITSSVLAATGFKFTAEKVDLLNPPSPISRIVIPSTGVKNTAATVTISCHADGDDIEIGVQQKVVIHYGSTDLFSASTGAIVSPLGKKIYGVTTTDTGTKNADGTPITSSVIGVTSSSNAQFVPMAFLNINYAGNETYNLNAQFGIGINPNGSSTQVEYFLSPLAYSLHHVYISPGVHIAQSQRISGGFYSGETVGSSFSVPTTYRTTFKFALTISVKPYK